MLDHDAVLPPDLERLDALFQAAKFAQAQAYAPYSNFKVGAALRSESGRVFSAANVENAAYPVGTCAEAGAISAMIVAGERRITEVLVIGGGPVPITPCGACRQRIREFGDDQTLVHSAGAKGISHSFTLSELLPESFGPDHLADR
jgi:cytidine deaminase